MASPMEHAMNTRLEHSTSLFGTRGSCTCGFADVEAERPCEVHDEGTHPPSPIAKQVLRRPTYTSTHGTTMAAWLEANEEDLREWYELTAECSPEERPWDFRGFIETQWDLAVEHDQRFRDGLYDYQLAQADAEDDWFEGEDA